MEVLFPVMHLVINKIIVVFHKTKTLHKNVFNTTLAQVSDLTLRVIALVRNHVL